MNDHAIQYAQGTPDRSRTIVELVTQLGDPSGVTRQRARQALVAIGPRAVEPLMVALRDPRDQVRWEAAKALTNLTSRRAAASLVHALQDENGDVRWLAAEGLIALQEGALRPLLKALSAELDGDELREGAHHVFHELARRGFADVVNPVLRALESPAPAEETPVVAYEALLKLEQMNKWGPGKT
jgi:HEAT repeat protein